MYGGKLALVPLEPVEAMDVETEIPVVAASVPVPTCLAVPLAPSPPATF